MNPFLRFIGQASVVLGILLGIMAPALADWPVHVPPWRDPVQAPAPSRDLPGY